MCTFLKLSPTDVAHFFACFGKLPDVRKPARVKYPMSEILFLVVCGVVSGYESNRAIADFGELKLGWLRKFFPFRHGIPTHETIGDIIGLIDKSAFESAFMEWAQEALGSAEVPTIHLDGKRLRGSVNKDQQNKKFEQGGKHIPVILNAYASDTAIVVGQLDTSDQGEEKMGAKKLLEQLYLKDKTITGDSNFCTKDILDIIRRRGGHYVMALKGNNPKLLDLAQDYFGNVLIDRTTYYDEEVGHGRQEKRTYQTMEVILSPHQKLKEYSGLRKVVRVRRQRLEVRSGKSSDETQYYITSSDKGVEELARLIRRHWSIENNLHWVLDTEFREDDSRKRAGNQAANFSLINKIALNLLNKNRGAKSIRAARMACALSDRIRENVLGFP